MNWGAIGGIAGALCVIAAFGAWLWPRRNRLSEDRPTPDSGHAAQTVGSGVTIIGNSNVVGTPSHEHQRVPADVAEEHHPGPFPPFSLGGSLDINDYFDFMMAGTPMPGDTTQPRRWRPVKNYNDVEIDWRTWPPHIDFFADVTLTGGPCRAGILDVENDVIVATSDFVRGRRDSATGKPWADAPRLPELDELIRVQIRIPRASGRKTYRLMVQPDPLKSSTYWIKGEVAFPVYSLGGALDRWLSPTTEPLVRAVIEGRDVEIDWESIKDPINSVIAEIVVTVSNPTPAEVGAARVIVWNVTDNKEAVRSDRIEKRWHWIRQTGWHSPRREPWLHKYVTRPPAQVRLQVPPFSRGKKSYRLLTEVEQLGTGIAAAGWVLLRH